MKNKLYILLFILTLVLYACTNTVPVNQISQNDGKEVKQVQVIATCDDSNQCTDDVFNQLTQQCEHKRKTQCCGDSTCDSNERCDFSTHKTICPEDCPRQCPGVMLLNNIQCAGKCINTGDYYIVDDSSKFTFQLQNVGELSVSEITSNFKCIKQNGNVFTSNSGSTSKSGVSFSDYFNTDEKKIYLSGIPYGKDKANYTFELKGKPEEDVFVTCTITIVSTGNPVSHDIGIKLVKNQ